MLCIPYVILIHSYEDHRYEWATKRLQYGGSLGDFWPGWGPYSKHYRIMELPQHQHVGKSRLCTAAGHLRCSGYTRPIYYYLIVAIGTSYGVRSLEDSENWTFSVTKFHLTYLSRNTLIPDNLSICLQPTGDMTIVLRVEMWATPIGLTIDVRRWDKFTNNCYPSQSSAACCTPGASINVCF